MHCFGNWSSSKCAHVTLQLARRRREDGRNIREASTRHRVGLLRGEPIFWRYGRLCRGMRSLAGVGCIVFAHKWTDAWEVQIQSLVDSGWIVTASWPSDAEMGSRLRAMNSAVLASSVHLVCRPREITGGSAQSDEVGDWRDVLQELPRRIHEWMPRLAEEGVVGADAIFACLGPALEVFSRYSRVE